MPNHLYIEDLMMKKSGRLFQRVFPNQVEQQLPFLLQIQKLRVNSTQSTTMEYLSPMILVFRGEDLTSNGQKNIFHKILGHLQSDRTNSLDVQLNPTFASR